MVEESKSRNMTPVFALIGLAVVAMIGYAVYKLGFDSYTIRPETIFTEAFSDSPVIVSDLTAGGMKSGNYSYWIHFKLAGQMATLKKKDEFKKDDADLELARRWFVENLKPPVPTLETSKEWKLFNRVDNGTSNISQEWYMYNWKTDDHIYRKWGY